MSKALEERTYEEALAWLREVDQVRVADEQVTDNGGALVIEYWQTEPSGPPDAPPTRWHYRVDFAADGSHDVIRVLL